MSTTGRATGHRISRSTQGSSRSAHWTTACSPSCTKGCHRMAKRRCQRILEGEKQKKQGFAAMMHATLHQEPVKAQTWYTYGLGTYAVLNWHKQMKGRKGIFLYTRHQLMFCMTRHCTALVCTCTLACTSTPGQAAHPAPHHNLGSGLSHQGSPQPDHWSGTWPRPFLGRPHTLTHLLHRPHTPHYNSSRAYRSRLVHGPSPNLRGQTPLGLHHLRGGWRSTWVDSRL